jgi:hypothetical protein
MAKATPKAKITWDGTNRAWTLYLWIDNEWCYSKAWATRQTETPTGETVDWICDNILSEIAMLQNIGYEVKIR